MTADAIESEPDAIYGKRSAFGMFGCGSKAVRPETSRLSLHYRSKRPFRASRPVGQNPCRKHLRIL